MPEQHQDRGTLVVAGQGYVGLPLAVRAVQMGWSVIGVEPDPARAKRLQAGESYVDDITSEELAAALETGRYHPAQGYEGCQDFDVAVITVPTPLRDGNPDLSYIEDASRSLARCLKKGATVILESTTYPGTTEELVVPILEQSGLQAGQDFHLGYSPERIDPGNKTWTFVTTPKVVSGIDPESLEKVRAFYDSVIDTTVPVATPCTALTSLLMRETISPERVEV